MGKQSEATVYYCDICRKSIIGTPLIIKDAEYLATSQGHSLNVDLSSEIEYQSNVINKICVPQIKTGTQNENLKEQTCDVYLEAVPLTLYLCQECLEDKIEPYITLCNEFTKLFESK